MKTISHIMIKNKCQECKKNKPDVIQIITEDGIIYRSVGYRQLCKECA